VAQAEHLNGADGSGLEDVLGPVGQWQNIESIRDSKFFGEILNRLVSGRDMNIIITAASETGVGKTTLAVAIATLIDQHGWTADKAAVASPVIYDRLYDESPPGSCLILDEAEKAADARRGMTTESVTLSQSFAAKRYQQIFSILTAPSKSWVDNRLGGDAADYWIQAQQTDMGRVLGQAIVYRLKNNEHQGVEYVERVERIHWPNMDDDPEMQALDDRKQEVLETESETDFVKASKVEEARKEGAKEAAREKRNEIIKALDEAEAVSSQDDIADVVDLSKGRVNQIINQ